MINMKAPQLTITNISTETDTNSLTQFQEIQNYDSSRWHSDNFPQQAPHISNSGDIVTLYKEQHIIELHVQRTWQT